VAPIVSELRKIAKEYGVKILFRRLKGAVAGTADVETGTITINSLLSSRQEIFSAFFHELMHCIVFKKGIWRKYHETEDDEERLKTALKVERYIDREAAFLMHQYDARLKFLPSYSCDDKSAKEFLKNYYLGEEK
jgi:hypothetical protein